MAEDSDVSAGAMKGGSCSPTQRKTEPLLEVNSKAGKQQEELPSPTPHPLAVPPIG